MEMGPPWIATVRTALRSYGVASACFREEPGDNALCGIESAMDCHVGYASSQRRCGFTMDCHITRGDSNDVLQVTGHIGTGWRVFINIVFFLRNLRVLRG